MPDDEEEIMNFREELDKLGKPNHDLVTIDDWVVPCAKAKHIAHYFKKGSSPYRVGEIDLYQFKKEHKNQYKLIDEVLEINGINIFDLNSMTPKQLTSAFNTLIAIPNLIELLDGNKVLSAAQENKADSEAIIKNKKKLAAIYPHSLEMSLKYVIDGEDTISKNIIKIKNGDMRLAMAFGLYAAKMMDTSIKYNCIMRALSHEETNITDLGNSAMDYFAAITALSHSAHYGWDSLRKRRPHAPLHTLDRQERIEALTDNYYCTEIPYNNILVVDDITTSGTTAKAIYEAIVQENPNAKVSFLMIGKTWGNKSFNTSRNNGKFVFSIVPRQVAFDDKVFQSCVKCCEKWCLADLDRWSKI